MNARRFPHINGILFRLIILVAVVLNTSVLPVQGAAAIPDKIPSLEIFDCLAVSEIPLAECEALVALYNSTNGTAWIDHTGWLQTITPCSWYGVSCELSTNVTRIDLNNNQLIGSIPNTFGNLTLLQYLDLGRNQLSGSIPPEIGNLTFLERFDLRANQLSGSIPIEIGGLGSLAYLSLAFNQLTGPIPAEIGNLTSLQTLYLGNNQLSGSIPPEIGNLVSLGMLHLPSNQLSGSLPAEIGNLTSLYGLHLNSNQLTGSIPPEIGNLTAVDWLNLSSNMLTGEIPNEIGNLSNLRFLWLENNKITGNIPPSLSYLTKLEYLQLQNNQLSGEIPPSLANLVNLKSLLLDNNHQINGTFPPAIQYMVNLENLSLHHTQISGTIPGWIGVLTRLKSLHLENNQLTGPIPEEIAMLNSLEDLNLSMNRLTGPIPGELGNIPSLNRVYLGGNQFSGGFPAQFTSLPNLEILHLYNANLSGPLPAELGDFPAITSLDLSNNHFSGPVPTEIGNLVSLQQLWLGHNDFSGEVPLSITNLTNLNTISVCGLSSTNPDVIAFLNGIDPGWHCSNARLHVQMVENNVEGYDWPGNTPVTLTIDDPANGVGVDFSDTQMTNPDGWVRFADLGPIDLAPGMYVTMTDEVILKTHTVTDITVTNVNYDADTVSGTGTSGARLNIQYCSQSGCQWRRWATVVDDAWEVNFAVPGTGPDEQLILNIKPGIVGEALQADEDTDHTDYAWGEPAPFMYVGPDSDYIYTRNWPIGVPLELTVDNDTNLDNGYLYRISQDTEPLADEPGIGHSNFNLRDASPPFDLLPDQYVFISHDTTTIDTRISHVTFDEIDPENQMASGTGPAERSAQVTIRTRSGTYGVDLVIDPDGTWLADFSDQGVDFHYIVWSTIDVWDEDFDTTFINGPESPTITADLTRNVIFGGDWPVGETATLTIDDPSNGTGIDFQQEQTPGPPPWDPNGSHVEFYPGDFTLGPGDLVEIESGTITKTLEIQYVEVTDIDVDADTISGLADPGVEVFVYLEGPHGFTQRQVMSDSDDGTWSLDFSVLDPNDNESIIVNITPGMTGGAVRLEDDEDLTDFSFTVDWVPPDSVPLVFAINSSPDLSVPQATVENISILNTMLDGLFRLDQDGSIQPLAATRYTVSPDGLKYTVTLRPGALWSDGQPVTAQQYVDGILRVLDPAVGSDYGFILYSIVNAEAFNNGSITDPSLVGVKALDAQTIELTLVGPAMHFAKILASPVMLPARQDLIDQYGDAWTSPEHFVSNGPYKLLEYDGGHVLVENNLLYNGPMQGTFSQIGFDVTPDPADQVASYKNGTVDVLLSTPVDTILNDPILMKDLTALPLPGVQYLSFFTTTSPVNDPLVRKALAAAVDRNVLVDDVLQTSWRVEATGVIPPELDGYQGSTVGYSFNPVQAQAYLEQAGYPGGTGFPGLKLFVASPIQGTILGALKNQWETVLDIPVSIDYVSGEERGVILSSCDANPSACPYNGYLAGWAVDYADAFNILNDLFSPDSPYNHTQWDNAAYRSLLSQAISEPVPAQRISYLQQAEKILVQDDAAVLPLYYLDGAMVVRPGIYPYYSPSYFSNLAYWSDVDPPGDGMTAGVIDEIGGTVVNENNTVTADVPAGALDEGEEVTMSVTDQGGNYQVTTSQQALDVLGSFSIQPHGLQFNVPVTLTFAWSDIDDDGYVDVTGQDEKDIFLLKDGQLLTPLPCEQNQPACDMEENILSVEVNSLSHFELAADVTPPVVTSITRAGPNPTGGESVTFNVNFSEDVSGIDTGAPFPDFILTATGVSNAAITSVSGAGSSYSVTVDTGTGTGQGTIRLDVLDDNSILDLAGNPLGGPDPGDGDFNGGEVYDINIPSISISIAAQDGWILESKETSGIGGTLNSAATTLRVGDDAANKQYMSVLSFDTSALPDNAVITKVTLKFKYAGKTGTLPFDTHGKLYADIRKGAFGTSALLQPGDFNAFASKLKALIYANTPVDNWYSQSLNPVDFAYIKLNGKTQFRLRFNKDDNNDRGADFLKLYSGSAAETDRPQLIIEYYVP